MRIDPLGLNEVDSGNLELRPTGRTVSDPKLPAVGLDHLPDDVQAEAGPGFVSGKADSEYIVSVVL